MLDIKMVRRDPDFVARELARRDLSFDVDAFLQLDASRKQADIDSQNLQAEKKLASKQIGELVKAGTPVDEAKQTVNAVLERISAQLDDAAAAARRLQTELDNLMMSLPNLLAAVVPVGKTEADNQELERWGEPRVTDFEVLDHVDVGARLNGLDFEMAAKITGARFAVMSGPVARMHRALTQFMLDLYTREHGSCQSLKRTCSSCAMIWIFTLYPLPRCP